MSASPRRLSALSCAPLVNHYATTGGRPARIHVDCFQRTRETGVTFSKTLPNASSSSFPEGTKKLSPNFPGKFSWMTQPLGPSDSPPMSTT